MKRNQPHVKGEENRIITGACVHPDTYEDIVLLANEYEVSVSWVVAFALETFLYGRSANPMPTQNRKKTNRR